MSTIQQLKNFIRHGKPAQSVFSNVSRRPIADFSANPPGKQARVAQDEPQRKHDNLPSMPQPPRWRDRPRSPASAHSWALTLRTPSRPPPPAMGAVRAAQAGNVAAHNAEATQALENGKTKNRRVDDGHIAKIVAEENASRGKFPKYPGLENWELVEKMGDGAFSNVYRARDRQTASEVAIKVVRKYEMNSMQVSCCCA